MKRIITVLFVLFAVNAFAQKYGHCNAAEIAMELPELKEAEAQFQTKTNELEGRLQRMFELYQGKVDEFQQNAPTMSEEEQRTTAAEIQNLEARIQEAQQNSQQELAEFDAKLKAPIMDRVKNAISLVSTENGYTLIFDMSTGAILYAGGDDITDLVKTKLGI
jgi:outer membrane protein